MRKVNKYTIIIISISLFIVMPLFLGTPKQRAAKREFSNKFEAYNAIKESLINELQKSNSQRMILYPDGVITYHVTDIYSDIQSFMMEDEELLNNLNLLNEVTGTSFDRCMIFNFNGHIIVGFVYDWERAYGNTYNICYSENLEALELHASEGMHLATSYTLKKLKNNWYYLVYNH